MSSIVAEARVRSANQRAAFPVSAGRASVDGPAPGRTPPVPDPSAPQPLFRQEVADAHANRLWGDVILVQPLSTRAFAVLVGVIALCLGVFGACAEYARTETVVGFVAPDTGVSKLYPARPGTVTEVVAQVGDRVDAGSILMTVSSGLSLADGGGLEEAQADQLRAQQAELEAKIDTDARLLDQQQRRGAEQVETLKRQLEQLRSLRLLVEERRDIAEERRANLARLIDRGAATRSSFEEQRDLVLNLQAELLGLDRQLLTAGDELGRVRAELESAPLRARERRADVRFQLAQVQSQLNEVESRSSYAVQAPTAGRVAALQATPGGRVSPDVPVAVILPEGGKLQANLFVPTRAVGFVEPGQQVGVKYAAFPHQRFGIYSGRIVRLERAILNPEEVQTPVPLREPAYRAVAELRTQEVVAFGRAYPIQPGMLLEAEIVLERRSVLEWMLEPLYGLRGAR